MTKSTPAPDAVRLVPALWQFHQDCSDNPGKKITVLEARELIKASLEATAPAPATARGGDALRIAVEALEKARVALPNPTAKTGKFAEVRASIDQALANLATQPAPSPGGAVERLREMRAFAVEMISKHGNPIGTPYEEGQNDMGHRWVTSIDQTLVSLGEQPLPAAPSIQKGDEG